MPDNRIEVNLHLATQDDLVQLQTIMKQFTEGVQTLTGKSVNGLGGQPARMGNQVSAPSADAVAQSDGSGGPSNSAGHSFIRNMMGDNKFSRWLTGTPIGGAAVSAAEAGLAVKYVPDLLGGLAGAGYSALNNGLGITPLLAQNQARQYGAQIGLNMNNGALPFTSSAAMQYYRDQIFQPLGNAFNFNFNPAQYREAASAIQSYGYNPDTGMGANMMGLMNSIGSSPTGGGVSVQDRVEILDRARYGASTLAGLAGQIKQLGDVAVATQSSLSHTTEAYKQLTGQLADQRGISTQAAGTQIMAMGAATGMPIDEASKPMGDTTIRNLTIGMSGGNVYNALWGKNAGLQSVHAVELIVTQLTGTRDFTELGRVLRAGGPRAAAIKNLIASAYMSNNQIFGGYTPPQVIQLAMRGDSQINSDYHAMADLNIAMGLKSGGTGQYSIQNLAAEAQRAGVSGSDVRSILGSGKSYTDMVGDLSRKVSAASQTTQQQRNQVYLGLSPDARRLLRLIPSNGNVDSANGNPNAMPATASGVPWAGTH